MVKGCYKDKIDVGHFIFFPPLEVPPIGESSGRFFSLDLNYCIIANFTSQYQQSFPFSLSSVVLYF